MKTCTVTITTRRGVSRRRVPEPLAWLLAAVMWASQVLPGIRFTAWTGRKP